MSEVIVEHAPANVVVLRNVPVGFNREFLIILVGCASGQRDYTKRIVGARQNVLEFQRDGIEARGRNSIARERRFYHDLMAGIGTSCGARKKASRVRIEYLPCIEG